MLCHRKESRVPRAFLKLAVILSVYPFNLNYTLVLPEDGRSALFSPLPHDCGRAEKWLLVTVVIHSSDREKKRLAEVMGAGARAEGPQFKKAVYSHYEIPLLKGNLSLVHEKSNSMPCHHDVMLLLIGSGKRQCRKRANCPTYD